MSRKPWRVVFTVQARKDARKIARAKLRPKAEAILELLRRDPYRTYLAGACSRRINIQHRLVYQVLDKERTVKVLRMWTHYE